MRAAAGQHSSRCSAVEPPPLVLLCRERGQVFARLCAHPNVLEHEGPTFGGERDQSQTATRGKGGPLGRTDCTLGCDKARVMARSSGGEGAHVSRKRKAGDEGLQDVMENLTEVGPPRVALQSRSDRNSAESLHLRRASEGKRKSTTALLPGKLAGGGLARGRLLVSEGLTAASSGNRSQDVNLDDVEPPKRYQYGSLLCSRNPDLPFAKDAIIPQTLKLNHQRLSDASVGAKSMAQGCKRQLKRVLDVLLSSRVQVCVAFHIVCGVECAKECGIRLCCLWYDSFNCQYATQHSLDVSRCALQIPAEWGNFTDPLEQLQSLAQRRHSSDAQSMCSEEDAVQVELLHVLKDGLQAAQNPPVHAFVP